jgi:branched-chain amino acid transport system permease protein
LLLTLLPNWTTDLAHSFSLSTNVANNLPLAIYGVVLIAVMLAWPTGIQGGVRVLGGRLRRLFDQGATPSSAAWTSRKRS